MSLDRMSNFSLGLWKIDHVADNCKARSNAGQYSLHPATFTDDLLTKSTSNCLGK